MSNNLVRNKALISILSSGLLLNLASVAIAPLYAQTNRPVEEEASTSTERATNSDLTQEESTLKTISTLETEIKKYEKTMTEMAKEKKEATAYKKIAAALAKAKIALAKAEAALAKEKKVAQAQPTPGTTTSSTTTSTTTPSSSSTTTTPTYQKLDNTICYNVGNPTIATSADTSPHNPSVVWSSYEPITTDCTSSYELKCNNTTNCTGVLEITANMMTGPSTSVPTYTCALIIGPCSNQQQDSSHVFYQKNQ